MILPTNSLSTSRSPVARKPDLMSLIAFSILSVLTGLFSKALCKPALSFSWHLADLHRSEFFLTNLEWNQSYLRR